MGCCLFPEVESSVIFLWGKKGRRGSTERESWTLTCVFSQLCPMVPVGAGVSAVIRLDPDPAAHQHCAGGDKAVFVPPVRLLRSKMRWELVRCSVRCHSCRSAFVLSARLCVPWPSATQGAGDSQGTVCPAALCAGSVSPWSWQAAPFPLQAGGCCCCFESPPLPAMLTLEPSSLLLYSKNRSVSLVIFYFAVAGDSSCSILTVGKGLSSLLWPPHLSFRVMVPF